MGDIIYMFYKNNFIYLEELHLLIYHYLKCKLTFIPKINIYWLHIY